MPMSGEPAPLSSILDHYGGFAPAGATTPGSDRTTFLRQNSDRSLHSLNTGSSNGHHMLANRIHADNNSYPLPSPLNTPSVRSSSSSLRQTVDMLKAGVYPPGMGPGMQRMRTRPESSSDGSHYDDDESEDHGFQVERGDPFESTPNRLHHLDPNADIFSNALDSPMVPQRRSSQHSSLYAKRTSNSTSPSSPASPASPVKGKGGDVGKNKTSEDVVSNPDVTSTSTPTEVPISPSLSIKSTPPKKNQTTTAMTRATTDVPPLSEQRDTLDLERELAMAAERDPNRPKTLKEARAFAKERARLRLQAKDGVDASSSAILETAPPPHPLREEVTRTTDKELPRLTGDSAHTLGSSEVKSPDSTEWRGHSRQLATPITPRGEEEERGREIIPSEKSSARAMEDLQSAVGDALQDLSFSSSTATGETIGPNEPSAMFQSTSSLMKLDIPALRGDGENASSALSITSFASAQDTMTKSRRTSFLQSHGHDTDNGSTTQDEVLASPEPLLSPVLPLTPAKPQPDASTATHSPETSIFVPHRLQTQQRSTAPNKIARLDIYGKTVPWPPAFQPAAIIEQRRLAPWERARSYAHYCNDLCSTPTGLQVWMEMVQRPAQRAEPATPVKRHLRGDATDHSGYAASVRSDMTFPMRGDGARAKELVAHIPAVVNDSPPNLLPHNIPYPMLVQQAGRSSSSSIDDHSSTPTSDRGLNRPGFFTSLGRKSSTRRTPGTGSMSSFSALSSSTSSTAIRSRGKQPKTISSPMNLNSSPSLAKIKSGFENFTSSPEVQSSPSSHSAQQKFPQPLSPAVASAPPLLPPPPPPPPSRTPMGPRAPASGSTASLSTPTSAAGAVRRGSATSTASHDKAAATTDYRAAAESRSTPTSAAMKSSLSYASIREPPKRSPRSAFGFQPTSMPQARVDSSDSSLSKSQPSSRRGSHQIAPPTAAENEALDKLSDVLPDAERDVLLEHLRKAGNNDLLAIGSYLQQNALSEGKVLLR